MSKLAVVRIAGATNLRKPINDTLDMLKLSRKHACVIIEDTPNNRGMLQKVKDCVTWGTVSDETIKKIDAKRKGDKKAVFLHPPIGGFERGGTKTSYSAGGVLGDRKEIDALITKMLPQ